MVRFVPWYSPDCHPQPVHQGAFSLVPSVRREKKNHRPNWTMTLFLSLSLGLCRIDGTPSLNLKGGGGDLRVPFPYLFQV